MDIVVTPGEVVRTRTGRQSPGAIWEALDDAKIAAIPVLADQRPD